MVDSLVEITTVSGALWCPFVKCESQTSRSPLWVNNNYQGRELVIVPWTVCLSPSYQVARTPTLYFSLKHKTLTKHEI